MALTKFQVVFGIEDGVDLQMLLDGEMRFTRVDLADAPFAKTMLSDPEVKDALQAWVLEGRGPSWMSWTDIEAALLDAGINLDRLLAAYRATSAG
jgi:hypothetical protein